jgi:hypothetical protein
VARFSTVKMTAGFMGDETDAESLEEIVSRCRVYKTSFRAKSFLLVGIGNG